jgi:large subunit ribosomal protein L18
MKKDMRSIRHTRIRKKVEGTAAQPRLCVFRSDKHIYAQIIDDSRGATLVAASTNAKGSTKEKKGLSIKSAFSAGEVLAAKAKEKGISQVCFDRGGYKYHGKIKALADGARKGGLKF